MRNKLFKIFVVFILFLNSNSIWAQNDEILLLKIKNFNALALILASNVDISINGNMQINSRETAISRLKTFLNVEEIIQFELQKGGSSKDNSSNFSLAEMVTSSGTYRVFMFFEKVKGKKLIKEIRIDKK